MNTEITFKTVGTPSKMGGGHGECRCNLIHAAVLSPEMIAEDMARTLHMDAYDAERFLLAMTRYMERALAAGCKLNFGPFSVSLSIRGTVDGANGAYTPGRNSLRLNMQANGRLKRTLDELRPQNVTARKRDVSRIQSVVDTATGEENRITPGAKTLLAGNALALDAAAPDEGVWLETGGKKVLRGRVLQSTNATLDCIFEGDLEPGEYTLSLYTRHGEIDAPMPEKATRKVEILRE